MHGSPLSLRRAGGYLVAALALAIAMLAASSAGALSTHAATDPPITGVSFTASPTTATVNQQVTFTASTPSGGTGTYAYVWDFGDGATGVGPQVQHPYTAAKTYTVTLTVSDGVNTATATQQYTVTPASGNSFSVSSITVTPSNPTINTAVSFEANLSGTAPSDATYAWDFGDGNNGTGNPTTHSYTAANTYTVKVTVTGTSTAGTETASGSTTVTVTGSNFSVSITAQPPNPMVGTQVIFVANVSGTPPSNPTISWTFGDGATASTNPAPHTYTSANTYTVTATVTGTVNGNTETQTASTSITVTGNTTVTITANPANPTTGESVTLTAALGAGSFPSDAVFNWSFGDGTSNGTANPTSHTYNQPGTYTVTVTVTSPSQPSYTATGSLQLTVTGNPVTAFTLSISGPTSGTAGQSLTFTAQVASGTAPSDIQYTWNFDDGSANGSGPTVTHTFNNPGSYVIQLTGQSASNSSEKETANLTVNVTLPSGPTVTYAQGWNLVGGPSGQTFTQADGPLYSYPAGATAYTAVPNTTPISGGQGFWAYFSQSTTVALTGTSSSTASVSAPAGQYIMVGNPSTTQTLTIHGADVAYTWSPSANSYSQATSLTPGQAAWVYVAAGGTVTVGP